MKNLKRIMAFAIAIILIIGTNAISYADLRNIEGNSYFTQSRVPTGYTGKLMSVTFNFTADKDYDNAFVGISYDEDINNSAVDDKGGVNTYPFEATKETLGRKSIGKMKAGQTKAVSVTARVRKDIPAGYYAVQVYVSDSKDGGTFGPQEYVNVWIGKSGAEDKNENVQRVKLRLKEGQLSPSGKYPSVMNFNLKMSNLGNISAFDVNVSMVMDKDVNVFPFDINEVSYDRHFDKIEKLQDFDLPYSFAIRKDAYTGFYPIKLKITYRESQYGEVLSDEEEFFVYVTNKEKDTTASGDFNANDRTRARIIVDSFRTVPEKVYAGDKFELYFTIKNASQNVNASNILFTYEPEKVQEMNVFSAENGANSIVVPSLASNEKTELKVNLSSKPSLEERSYAFNIKEKYDSPEFKNAEENVVINIPIYQKPKLHIGNIDVVPESPNEGEDVNVMFPINNTGKVMLYNTMVSIEGDTLKKNETYVGNIKPGETGNFDAIINTVKATEDEGNVKVVITYENEAGEVSKEEKDITIFVNPFVGEDMDDMANAENDKPEKKSGISNIKKIIIVAVAAAIVSGAYIFKKKRGKKGEK